MNTDPLQSKSENKPRPMTGHTTFEASSRITRVLSCSTTAMRQFDSYLVTHEVALMILGNALFSSLPGLKFLRIS